MKSQSRLMTNSEQASMKLATAEVDAEVAAVIYNRDTATGDFNNPENFTVIEEFDDSVVTVDSDGNIRLTEETWVRMTTATPTKEWVSNHDYSKKEKDDD